MKRTVFLGATTLVLLAMPTRADGFHKRYGGVGVQSGFYRHPGGFGVQTGFYRHPAAAAGCHGYAPAYGYALPSAGLAAPGLSPGVVMMAPAGGCTGSGFGYGLAAPGYGYAHGYGAVAGGYGYGHAAPQAGIFQVAGFGGGILDMIRTVREVREALEQLRPESPRPDQATKDDIKRLQDEVAALRRDLTTLKVPENLDARLNKLNDDIQRVGLDVQRARLDIDRIDKLLKK
jgi:hypothetical protein